MVQYSCVSLSLVLNLLVLLLPSVAFGFLGPNPRASSSSTTTESRLRPRPYIQYVHSDVVSPFSPQLAKLEAASLSELKLNEDFVATDDDNNDDGTERSDVSDSSDQLGSLCRMLGATPKDSLRLESKTSDAAGVRGVYLNKPVKEGEVILSVPLEACLSDESESVPQWMMTAFENNEVSDDEGYTLGSWATRVAASLIDLQLQNNQTTTGKTVNANANANNNFNPGHKLWLSMLPDPDLLQASLPVHWEDDTVQSTRCTALELARDSAYFARAQAIEDLLFALTNYCDYAQNGKSAEELRTMCDQALDVVQTRTCRLDRGLSNNDNDGRTYGPPLRVLAPIFDLINHGSAKNRGRESGANAQYVLEGDDDELYTKNAQIVVRATRDLRQGDEVLIDYGPSTQPAWRCLLSYGFVPYYRRIPAPGESSSSSSSSSSPDDDEDEENVAEVYMDGIRFEVGPSSIPVDMVAAAMASLKDERTGGAIGETIGGPLLDGDDESKIALTPEVALRISRRISDVAYQLLLEPEQDMYDDHPSATPTTFQLISNQLAASLRFSQHRVLLACALGLKDCATEETSYL
jgi:hypothetical protein